MVRLWSVLPERRPVHLLEEPEDGAELGGGAVGAFSELVGVRILCFKDFFFFFFLNTDKSASDRDSLLQGHQDGRTRTSTFFFFLNTDKSASDRDSLLQGLLLLLLSQH